MKGKYNLSKEGMESLTKKLEQIAQEGLDSDGLQTVTISTNFVKVMTKVKGIEDVIERNEQLSKTYQGFLNLYGFDTMYDMYIYAKSCDLLPEEMVKSGSRKEPVIPVERVIIRNGKPESVTVWEILDKSEPKPKKEEDPAIRHAREYHVTRHDMKETMDTKNVAKLKAAAEKLTGGKGKFNDGSNYYLSVRDENNDVVAVIGYSEENEHMKMDFYRHNGRLNGTATRGLSELLRLAKRKQKGVVAEDNIAARHTYTKLGLQRQGDKWSISYEDLAAQYGESGSKSE